jgi:DnaJ-class molecular chaperone
MFDKECPVCGGDGECVTSHRYKCSHCTHGRITDPQKYEVAMQSAREEARNLANSVRIAEYRAMGG